MPTNDIWVNSDGSRRIHGLDKALEGLETAEGRIVLDFSAVHRIDGGAIRILSSLAARAGERAVEVVLRDVSIDVYKVLKLVRLESRFTFLAIDRPAFGTAEMNTR